MRSGHSRGRRGAKGQGEPHVSEERWMASYMDMVTVLMCTFIVLFSMSSINAKKFEELKNSLQTGFGVVKSQKVDTAKGIIVPPKDVNNKKTTTPTPLDLARIEVTNLQKLEAEINSSLSAEGLQSAVSYTIDARGLTIGLVGDQTFFNTNLATLTPEALEVIDTIGPILNSTTYDLSIEGHADNRPPGPPYQNNWQLAAARAVSVLQLLNQSGIVSTRLDAVSYGSAQAVAEGDTASEMAEERRVDVVVIDGQTEDVRNLIPTVLSQEDGAATIAAPSQETGGQ